MAFDGDLYAEVSGMLALATAHEVECGEGHILNGQIRPGGTAFDARFDENWQRE